MNTVKYTNSVDFECLEDLRETSMELALAHMGREKCKPYHAFSGSRSEYIIHFVLSGCGFYSANGNTWPLTSGQMFLIFPEEPVVYCADKNEPWSYAWVGFKGLRAATILKNCGFSKNCLVLPAPALDDYISCFDDLFKHISSSFSNELYRESIFLKLLAILSEHHTHLVLSSKQEQANYGGNNEYVKLAINYINEMYMQGIGVSDIADNIKITRSYLNHAFQKEMDISVQKYLMNFRMHKAANLLVSTTMSVKEISNAVGYHDQLVFSKAFKKKFGMSPITYRNYKDELETRNHRP